MTASCYPERVEVPSGSMWDCLVSSSERNPSAVALDYLGRRITYRDLIRFADKAASSMAAMGVGADDRVLLLMPNIPQTVFLLYALNKLNAVAIMMHPDSPADEVERVVREMKCKAVFLTKRSIASCAAWMPYRLPSACRVILMNMMRFAPLCFHFRKRRVSLIPGIEKERAFWGRQAAIPRTPQTNTEDKPAVILFSGGSFGEPKAVVLTNRNMNAAAVETVVVSGQADVSGMSILALMPVFHGFGLCVGVHTPLMSGATCVLLPKYLPGLCARTFRRLKIEFLPGVPTFFLKLIRSPEMSRIDLSHLRGVFCGGDRLTPEAKHEIDAFLAAHGAEVAVRQGYGLTESASVITLSPEGAGDDTIGLPLPNTKVRVVDPDTGADVENGRAGELWLSGPTVMLGYEDDAALTAQALITDQGALWLRTGDLVRRDENGLLHFEQRIKHMIVTSGYNVYPSAIESALRDTGLVADVAVIGLQDELRGQSVVAFVVADSVAITPEALSAALATRLPRYAIPHRILIVESLPRTSLGKIAYGRLEELARIDKSPRA